MTVETDADVRIKRRRAGTFHDRYPWLGPGLFVLSGAYFAAQIFVGWVWNPSYSLVNNTISDLGNTACGQYGQSYVCSPRHVYMNIAFIALGVFMAAGSLLIYQEFNEKKNREQVWALIGFSLMALGGIGAMLVGFFPENTVGTMHKLGAGVAIGGGNLAIFVLGLALVALPEGLRRNMLLFSALSVTALICFAFDRRFGIGAGTMERIAAYPETIWLIVFGIYISTNHRRDRRALATRDPINRFDE
jgi:hypothetical membrane protein